MQKKIALTLLMIATFAFLSGCSFGPRTVFTSQTGSDGGYFFSFWTNGTGSVVMTLDGGKGYSVRWSDVGNFTCGKGWAAGSGAPVACSGTYSNSGGGAVGIYGWTTVPLIEYYIVETKTGPGGPGNNPADLQGTVVSDGATYDIYKHQQVNQPSILGTQTFWQYISIRQTQRMSGTVTVQNHFDAWAGLGMNLGTMDYEILLTEAWSGSGNASATLN